MKSPCATAESSPYSLQLEKAHSATKTQCSQKEINIFQKDKGERLDFRHSRLVCNSAKEPRLETQDCCSLQFSKSQLLKFSLTSSVLPIVRRQHCISNK